MRAQLEAVAKNTLPAPGNGAQQEDKTHEGEGESEGPAAQIFNKVLQGSIVPAVMFEFIRTARPGSPVL